MGLAMLYTMRGIPCLYYGTEVLMKAENDHGAMRQDHYGGWPGDTKNAFTGEGLTTDEAEALAFVRELADLRKAHHVIGTGSLRQWAPYNDVYAYSWSNDEEVLLVMVNRNADPQYVGLDRMLDGLNTFNGTQVLFETKPLEGFPHTRGLQDIDELGAYRIASNGLTILRFLK
jgi:glycosidase